MTAAERSRGVAPVADRVGRDGADEQVAKYPSAQGGGKGQHHQSQKIEPALDRGESAFESEDRRRQQIEHQQQPDGMRT